MLISKKKFNGLIRGAFVEGYRQGHIHGQLYAMKEIVRWRRILESEPVGILADQIEEILKKKGFGND